MNELRGGISVPKGLKTNEIVGIYDPLMYSSEFHKKSKEHAKEHKGSLGENIVPNKNENRRKFGVHETHTPKVVRENYFNRLIQTGEELKKYRQ